MALDAHDGFKRRVDGVDDPAEPSPHQVGQDFPADVLRVRCHADESDPQLLCYFNGRGIF